MTAIARPAHTPEVDATVARYHADVVAEVRAAVEKEPVVVVGMAWNPHCRKATQALDEKGIAYKYLEYGSYVSAWKPRLALKIWAGWPTFPMVFVKGTLIGGNSDLRKALEDGTFERLHGQRPEAMPTAV